MTLMPPNHALQQTRRERRGCNRCVPWAGSLSLDRWATQHLWEHPETPTYAD